MLKQIFALTLLTLPCGAFADTTYVVREGDTVLKIADKVIGAKKDPRRYALAKKIKAMNPEMDDSNLLSPGQSIVIPDSVDAVTASIEPKKNNPKVIPVIMDETDKSTIAASADKTSVKEDAAPGRQPIVIADEETSAIVAKVDSAAQEEPAKLAPAPEVKPTLPPVPPPPPPTAKADEIKYKPANKMGYLSIQPIVDFADYKVTNNSTDRESDVKSRLNTGVRLLYGAPLSQNLHFLVDAALKYIQLDQFDDGTTSLNHTIQWQKRVALGVNYNFAPRWHLIAKVEGSDRLFILPNGTNSFDTESVFVPGVEVSLAWDLIQTDRNIFGALIGGHYFTEVSTGGVTYKSSVDPSASIYWMSLRGPDTLNYRLNIDYFLRNQNTDTTKQREEDVVFGMGLIIPIHLGE